MYGATWFVIIIYDQDLLGILTIFLNATVF